MNSFLSHGLQSAASKMLMPSIFTPNSLANPVCLQCVRWRKKPRWLPTAKTKMYRIPPRIKYPPEEEAEVLRLHNNYRTSMKAIRLFLAEKTKSQSTGEEVIAEQLRLEEEDHERCLALNDLWNKNVAVLREKRVQQALEELRLSTLEELTKQQQQDKEQLQIIEEIVRLEKAKSKSFITPDNIDEAIEKVLSETVDYNYCIDLSGNIYKGLRGRPGVSEPTKWDINDYAPIKELATQ